MDAISTLRKRALWPVLTLLGVIVATLLWQIHISRRYAALNAQLVQAVSDGDVAAAEELLRRGADPNFMPSDLAGMWQSVDRRFLINPRFWPSLVEDYRARRFESYPVLFAARDADMVRMLLAHGADPNREGYLEETALDEAAQYGNAAVARILLAGGANVRHRNRLGGTALHAVAEGIAWPPTPRGITDHHYADVMRALIAAGADLNAKTPQRKTALAIIKRSGRTRYMELLKKAGAKE